MTYPTQYDSNGVVQEFLHPDRLAVLRAKSSNAHVVRIAFLSDDAPCNVPVGYPECQQG